MSFNYFNYFSGLVFLQEIVAMINFHWSSVISYALKPIWENILLSRPPATLLKTNSCFQLQWCKIFPHELVLFAFGLWYKSACPQVILCFPCLYLTPQAFRFTSAEKMDNILTLLLKSSIISHDFSSFPNEVTDHDQETGMYVYYPLSALFTEKVHTRVIFHIC